MAGSGDVQVSSKSTDGKLLSIARGAGLRAYAQGLALQECPVFANGYLARAWRDGWQDGQDAAAMGKLEKQAPAPYRPRGGYYRGR